MHEKELLKVKDGGDLLVVLNGIGKNIVDADALIAFAYKSYNPAKPKTPSMSASANYCFTCFIVGGCSFRIRQKSAEPIAVECRATRSRHGSSRSHGSAE